MNFIDRSAENIARSIRNNYSQAGSEIALKYALSLLINSFIAFTTAIVFCVLTDHFIEALMAIVSFIALRYFSGGLHMSSSLSCCLLTIFIIISAAHISFNYSFYCSIIDIFSALILLKTAPNGIEHISKINPKYYPLLKLIAVLIVLANLFFQSTVMTAAFFCQALLTTEFSYRTRDHFEGRISK
ncbi:accessory gene regulator B family protein [Paenibacillus doosanensis]|uniref:Accessory gene regulator protein n=1 Tax=Paenibacillus konkukensis TaxID=2020716 RepID=A0ABY4RKB4_9BACL|nr:MULTISPECIES: accessory gene regulator B family protein [Paenibacillus]MCS7462237.1 accessory gene regulator B family protein [Paenibacillus doosanensis]UQZ82899.1 putative accessory gene regulator protein [Paenibacillus konkukensis]